MKSLPIDVSQLRCRAASDPQPLVDYKTKQQKADRDGQPLFTLDVLVSQPDRKSEVVTVRLAGTSPKVVEGDRVNVVGLVGSTWETTDDEGNLRHGITFSASKIEVATGKAVAA